MRFRIYSEPVHGASLAVAALCSVLHIGSQPSPIFCHAKSFFAIMLYVVLELKICFYIVLILSLVIYSLIWLNPFWIAQED